jgi:hypothetical protein
LTVQPIREEETMSDTPKADIAADWKLVAPPPQQQAELFEGMNALASAWMKRRQEALETGLEALQKMAACQDPAAAMRLYADWMAGSLSRIVADANDMREHTLKMMDVGQKTLSAQAATTMAAVGEQARAGAAQIEATQAAVGTTLRRAA